MASNRPYSSIIERLKSAGLRPTRQRLALAKLLFEKGNRHVTAEHLHGEASAANARISLATVYNALHQFTAPACCARSSSSRAVPTSTPMSKSTTTSIAKTRAGSKTSQASTSRSAICPRRPRAPA